MKSFLENKYSEWGEKLFAKRISELIVEDAEFREDFSIPKLWKAMGEPSFSKERIIQSRALTDEDLKEALDSSTFPKITSTLINRYVQDAYELAAGIGFQLVTKIPSSQREETIVGFADDHEVKEIGEGMPYQEGSITEKYHKIKNRKFGRIVSLTEEMIKFDQTGQFKLRAQRVGESARIKQESIILDAVLGNVNTGDYAAWRPQGTAATLYDDASVDPYTTATVDNQVVDTLADETDLDAAMVLFSAMTDEQGNPLMAFPDTLLTAQSLMGVAAKIVASGQSVAANAPAGVKNIWDRTKSLYSPFVDQKMGTTYWYFGNFKKQFIYTDVFPLQTWLAKPGNYQEFERDVAFRYKARVMGGCGAISNRYVVRSTGAGSE